jgi:hypothetical protein
LVNSPQEFRRGYRGLVRVVLALLALIVVAAGASAARAQATAPMRPADRKAISTLLNNFIKDAVRREDLAAGWELAGRDLRGGTTRAAWVAGTGVTVPYYPVAGTDFRNDWTGHLVAPGHAELSVILHPAPGHPGYEETAAAVDVRKVNGTWLVDLFYSAAVFHKRGISGPADFAAPGSSAGTGSASSRIAGAWLIAGLAAAGSLAILLPAGFWVTAKRRDRRARQAFADLNRTAG